MQYGYSEQGEAVVLTMTTESWVDLVLALGFATGAAAAQRDLLLMEKFIILSNRLNEGNPHFRPIDMNVMKGDM